MKSVIFADGSMQLKSSAVEEYVCVQNKRICHHKFIIYFWIKAMKSH